MTMLDNKIETTQIPKTNTNKKSSIIKSTAVALVLTLASAQADDLLNQYDTNHNRTLSEQELKTARKSIQVQRKELKRAQKSIQAKIQKLKQKGIANLTDEKFDKYDKLSDELIALEKTETAISKRQVVLGKKQIAISKRQVVLAKKETAIAKRQTVEKLKEINDTFSSIKKSLRSKTAIKK